MEAVHVLQRTDGGDGRLDANLRRERLLDEDPMDLRVGVEATYLLEEPRLRDVLGQLDGPVSHPHLFRGFALHLDIELGRGVLPDEDRRETGHVAGVRELRETRLEAVPDLTRDLLPIDD